MSAPFSEPLTPVSLKGDEEGLSIGWSDGAAHRIRWKTLRGRCPCATCRAKPSAPPTASAGLPVLSLAEAQPVRARGMTPVGNYAYAISFTDGHSGGIYTLEYLRQLGEESAG